MLVSPTRLMMLRPPLRPTLGLDFLSGSLDSSLTFTRASSGWYFNSSGALAQAATNAPRFDHDPATLAPRGLLMEEARTNSLRNNSGTGGVVGTPGTLPTNWNVVAAANLTTNVVAIGTENGIPYTDVQIVGTTNNTQYALSPESITQIVASNGQSWTCSGYVKLVAGSTANITNTRLTINGRLSGGGGVSGQSGAFNHTLTGTLTRTSGSFTMSDATVARVSMEYRLIFSSGVAVDITVRLGGLQLELGAFASSPILTTSAAATRAVDVCTVPVSAFPFNAAEGTLFVEATTAAGTASQSFACIENGSSNQYRLSRSNALAGIFVVSGGVTTASVVTGAVPDNSTFKQALAYRLDDFLLANNGTVAADTSGALPVGVATLRVGNRNSNMDPCNGWIRRAAYYNRRLDSGTLARITA